MLNIVNDNNRNLISVRPMREEDYILGIRRRVNQSVANNTNQDIEGNLDNKVNIELSVMSNKFKNTVNDHSRQYIPLIKPVINKVLTLQDYKSFAYLLNVPTEDIKALATFKKVLVIDEKEGFYEVLAFEAVEDDLQAIPNSSGRYGLIGGEAIKFLIDNYRRNRYAEKVLLKNEFFADKKKVLDVENYFLSESEIYDKENVTYLVADYYINKPFHSFTKAEIKAYTRFVKRMTSSMPSGVKIRFSNIESDEQVRERAMAMLVENLAVTPEGMRPSLDNVKDPSTMDYIAVTEANRQLINAIMESNFVKSYKKDYENLTRAVNDITDEYTTRIPGKNTDNHSSATEKLMTKFGLIRNKMLSKRQDFSGRSTISVNPKLRADECGIPVDILVKIFSYHLAKEKGWSLIEKASTETKMRYIKELKLLDRVPVILNRAPTLHKHSLLAFWAKVSQGKTIELCPLVCAGFNADFDGDQMGVHVPLGDEAIAEAAVLMLATKNLFHNSSGSQILVPKQEVIYGLNEATIYSNKGNDFVIVKEYDNIEEIYSDVYTHKVKVYDTVKLNGMAIQAGKAAFLSCFPAKVRDWKGPAVDKKTIMYYLDRLLNALHADRYENSITEDEYIQALRNITVFGYRMAKIYAPTVSILKVENEDALKGPVHRFEEATKDLSLNYQLGLEAEDDYRREYNKLYDKMNSEINETMVARLGYNNGYLRLVESGARGDRSNLSQIYVLKGQIKSSDNSSNSVLIKSSFLDVLSPLEHFQSAYGARLGMIDKVNKTADTGYADRLMFEGASDFVIVTDDCGTTDGLTIKKKDLMSFLFEENEDSRNAKVNKKLSSIIEGRYIVMPDGSSKYIVNKEMADEIAYDKSIQEVVVRSPITCKCPVCSKCYGKDLGTNRKSVVGLPIGYIAGQAVGEPGTQLTMRTFHKGGIVTKGDVTTDFDRLKAFLNLQDSTIAKKFNDYDPVAWDTGNTYQENIDTEYKKVYIIPDRGEKDNTAYKVVSRLVKIKNHVTKGKGMKQGGGTKAPGEIASYASLDEAIIYLTYLMYNTYEGKVDINFKHFEVIVASMIFFTCVRSESPDCKFGRFYTVQEFYKMQGPTRVIYPGDEIEVGKGSVFVKHIVGIKDISVIKNSFLSNIGFEKIKLGLQNAVLFGTEEKLNTNLGRMIMGIKPLCGTNTVKAIKNSDGSTEYKSVFLHSR